MARQSHVEGDSLFLAFKEKAIDSVQVFRHAKGSYFDMDKPIAKYTKKEHENTCNRDQNHDHGRAAHSIM